MNKPLNKQLNMRLIPQTWEMLIEHFEKQGDIAKLNECRKAQAKNNRKEQYHPFTI